MIQFGYSEILGLQFDFFLIKLNILFVQLKWLLP